MNEVIQSDYRANISQVLLNYIIRGKNTLCADSLQRHLKEVIQNQSKAPSAKSVLVSN